MLYIRRLGLIHEVLLNFQTDLQTDIKACSTKNLLWVQEHLKLCSGTSDPTVNTCVDHECQTIGN